MILSNLFSCLAFTLLSFVCATAALVVGEATSQAFLIQIQGQQPGFSKNGFYVTYKFDKTQKGRAWLGAGTHNKDHASIFNLRNQTLIIPTATPPVGLPEIELGDPLIFTPGNGQNNDMIINKTDDRLTFKPAKPPAPSSPPGENAWALCAATKEAPYDEVIYFDLVPRNSGCTAIYLKRVHFTSV